MKPPTPSTGGKPRGGTEGPPRRTLGSGPVLVILQSYAAEQHDADAYGEEPARINRQPHEATDARFMVFRALAAAGIGHEQADDIMAKLEAGVAPTPQSPRAAMFGVNTPQFSGRRHQTLSAEMQIRYTSVANEPNIAGSENGLIGTLNYLLNNGALFALGQRFQLRDKPMQLNTVKQGFAVPVD